jgi:serine phosphatase RsbU (regulator of sigma subunit)
LTTNNGLPLGIVAESEYEESQHQLTTWDTLVFVSDGVVEARNQRRDLFGFERLQQSLAEHPNADAIARSAQQFGQEDDITVISISRQAVGTKPSRPASAVAVSG